MSHAGAATETLGRRRLVFGHDQEGFAAGVGLLEGFLEGVVGFEAELEGAVDGVADTIVGDVVAALDAVGVGGLEVALGAEGRVLLDGEGEGCEDDAKLSSAVRVIRFCAADMATVSVGSKRLPSFGSVLPSMWGSVRSDGGGRSSSVCTGVRADTGAGAVVGSTR